MGERRRRVKQRDVSRGLMGKDNGGGLTTEVREGTRDRERRAMRKKAAQR